MKRIEQTFRRLANEKRTALIPYVTAGYPDIETTVSLLKVMAESGGDVIEVGMPFSDPMADGPVIQRACYQSLQSETRTKDVLAAITRFRESNDETPIVLMTYCNPIEAMGAERFARAAAEAGIDGVLTVDLPPEECDTLSTALKSHDLDMIFLLAPTTTTERAREICAMARGFVYYVSLKGVTGAEHIRADEAINRIREIKALTDLPVAIGFGVRDAATAANLATYADGVVVGSALVDIIARQEKQQDSCVAIDALLRELRVALDEARVAA